MLALLTPLASRAQAPTPNEPSPAPQAPNDPSPTPTPTPEPPNEPSPIAPDPSLPPNDPTLVDPSDPTDPNADPTADPTAPPSEPPDAPPPSTLPAGQEPVIHVELTPDSGLMTGDVLTLTLRVTTPARDEVTIPRGQSFAPFEVLHRPTPRVEVQGDRATHVIELELLALEPGDHELPSITLRVVTADGVVGEVQTAPLRVPVGSVLGNEPNAEPKPPTEPVEVWEDDYTLAWVLGGLGLILLGALFAWLFARWWRRRAKAAAPPPPPRPPWEVALEKLEALRLDRDAAVREERVVAWVDQVSDALREYLGRRYEFDGLESTTDEVVAELKKRKLIGLSLDEVIALLRDCDLVKFAKAPLGVEQSDLLLAGAFRVVRTTAPIAGVSADRGRERDGAGDGAGAERSRCSRHVGADATATERRHAMDGTARRRSERGLDAAAPIDRTIGGRAGRDASRERPFDDERATAGPRELRSERAVDSAGCDAFRARAEGPRGGRVDAAGRAPRPDLRATPRRRSSESESDSYSESDSDSESDQRRRGRSSARAFGGPSHHARGSRGGGDRAHAGALRRGAADTGPRTADTDVRGCLRGGVSRRGCSDGLPRHASPRCDARRDPDDDAAEFAGDCRRGPHARRCARVDAFDRPRDRRRVTHRRPAPAHPARLRRSRSCGPASRPRCGRG
ncbi:MAG: hypothetical protein MUE69_33595 [Myxococcota bacterium]|nr:hypothetical protein [Myxococcota bacterium]